MIALSGGISDYKNIRLSGNADKDITLFKSIFAHDDVVRIREVFIAGSCKSFLIYIDGMVDSLQQGETVIEALVKCTVPENVKLSCNYILKNILYANEITETENVTDMLRAILCGDSVLIVQNNKSALTIDTKGWKTRGINEPDSERVLQGPREGFEESAMSNLALIRRKLLTPDLCVEMMRIGRRSDTPVFICYLGSLADSKTVKELKRRLCKIDIDGILDSNYIAENIRDHKYSIIKTTGSTEKPDIVAARLLEGRIALVVEGTPVVLTLPYLFSENFQSDEDYYVNFTLASFSRILRWICFFIAIGVPGLFLAFITYHFDLLPTNFVITVSRLRVNVPLNSTAECLALLGAFEILKESGLRMPQNLGHALSVVGGLVVGQAAVEASIVSAPMLIAVSLSAIAGLMVPRLSGAVICVRFLNVIACAAFGIYGYLAVSALLALYIFNLNSFGVDCTGSFAHPDSQNLKDIFVRASWTKMLTRPVFNKNRIRKGDRN